MQENENHPHHQPEPLSRDDGLPEGCEADWLKWRSRMNRRHRFRQHAHAAREQKSSSSGGGSKLPNKADGLT